MRGFGRAIVVAAVDADLRPSGGRRRCRPAPVTRPLAPGTPDVPDADSRASSRSAAEVFRFSRCRTGWHLRHDRPTAGFADEAAEIRFDAAARVAPLRSPARARAPAAPPRKAARLAAPAPDRVCARTSRTWASRLSTERSSTCSASPRGDERPERPGDFEPQIAACRQRDPAPAASRSARAARTSASVASTGVDRPLQVEPCAIVVRHVGIQSSTSGGTVGVRIYELLHVIRARISGDGGNERSIGGALSRLGGSGRIHARLQLDDP